MGTRWVKLYKEAWGFGIGVLFWTGVIVRENGEIEVTWEKKAFEFEKDENVFETGLAFKVVEIGVFGLSRGTFALNEKADFLMIY